MGLDIRSNVPLAPLTTLGIGGPARFFVRGTAENEVVDSLAYARDNDVDVFILGGGSNILVADEGFDGLVIQIALKGIDRNGSSVTAAAGEDWDEFVRYCVENDLAGVECLSGIPGFVGGTPVQNVGAYGQEVAETIRSVRCLDRKSGEIVDLNNADCGFTYRTSIFNTTHRERYIVLAVTFELTRGGVSKIAYRDLAEKFAGKTPTLREVRNGVIEIRKSKSMVIDANDINSRSAGSFFKNPVVDNSRFEAITATHGDVPHFPFGDNVKVPAAWLIERAGFSKGFEHGNVGLSSNHVLAIINRGGGTAREVLELKGLIVDRVKAMFGIELSPEPLFIGSK